MMGQGESELSRKIIKALNARGHLAWKNHGSIFSRRGLSDISGFRMLDGKGFLLETKIKNHLTVQQYEFLITARNNTGCLCGVVTTVEEAIRIVESRDVQDERYWRSWMREDDITKVMQRLPSLQ
jgi:hypothetical protein